MSASAIYPLELSVPAPVAVLPSENTAIRPLLDLAILQANAAAAYVYRFGPERGIAALAAFAGPAPDAADSAGIAPMHWDRKTPIVLHDHAGADWRFAGFPEFHTGRFDGVASVPLLDSGSVAGVANFCRTGAASLSANSLAFLMNLSLPLAALLAASDIRRQLREARQDLADRKVVERAKGLLQARYQLTEEDAYLQIRRLSRRRRVPMREIARELITLFQS